MTRHFGYFIEHTLKPLIEQVDGLFEKTQHLKGVVDKETLNELIKTLVELELSKTIIQTITTLFISLIFAGIVWKILG